MKLIYADSKTEEYCTSIRAAMNLFGGDKSLVKSLFSRIDALEAADEIASRVKIIEIEEVSAHYE